jgi:hypothetical protein
MFNICINQLIKFSPDENEEVFASKNYSDEEILHLFPKDTGKIREILFIRLFIFSMLFPSSSASFRKSLEIPSVPCLKIGKFRHSNHFGRIVPSDSSVWVKLLTNR